MCLPSYSSSPLLPPPISTLFPYTTLFRSPARGARGCPATRAARFGPCGVAGVPGPRRLRQPHSSRSEEHTSELQSRGHLVCRLLLEKKKEQGRSQAKIEVNESKMIASLYV